MENLDKPLTLRQLQAMYDGVTIAEAEDSQRAAGAEAGRLAKLKGSTGFKISRLKDGLYPVTVAIKKERKKFKEKTAVKWNEDKTSVLEYNKSDYDELDQEFLDTTKDEVRVPTFKLSELVDGDGNVIIPMRFFNALYPIIIDDSKEVEEKRQNGKFKDSTKKPATV